MRSHRTAAILSTGDELVLGQLQDTNARWLAQRLTDRGVRVVEIAAVGDELAELASAIVRLSAKADVLVMTGGLGPTDGDLTRAALCMVSGDAIVDDPAQAQALTEKLSTRGRSVNARQLRQTQRPARARCLPNDFGTAPGLYLTLNLPASDGSHSCDVLALPGPPNELMPMWHAHAEPLLRPSRVVLTRLGYVLGMPEAECAARLGALTARDRTPLLGMTASGGILTLRHRYEGDDAAAGAVLLNADQAAVRELLGPNLFASASGGGAEGATPSDAVLAAAVLERLRGADQRLALAESCTGGLLGALLTGVPGSSAAMLGGVISYSNQLKQGLLGVPAELLAQHGAVSVPVAAAMATGAARVCRADWALSITGVAGPGGGTDAKPAGTVVIAVARRTLDVDAESAKRDAQQLQPQHGQAHQPQTQQSFAQGFHAVDVRTFLFTGDRNDVRHRACVSALAMLWFALNPASGPVRLSWEMPAG